MRDACLEVENLLLEEDRGRDERRARLVDLRDDEGSEEWRLAVCQVSWTRIDGVGTGIVVGNGDVMLHIQQVDEDG